MKKLTIEFVREQFEKEGYKLLSKEYVGAHTKLEYVCSKGHKHNITWQKWSQGRRCKYCNNSLYIDTVKEALNQEGYTLLSDRVISSKHKLQYVCPKGHKHSMTWANWTRGRRCKKCFFERIGISKSEIKKALEKEGYLVLDEFYESFNSKTKFKVSCKMGHTYKTSWNGWRNGYRCKKCAYIHLSNLHKHDFYFVKNSIELDGYSLLSNTYQNAFVKLKVRCPAGHDYSVKWNDWQQGYRCRKCANINNSIRFSGSGSWNWRGGISYEPYCPIWQDKEYKEDIKARDGYKCLNPCCSEISNRLVVHHIDYNKKECSLQNLVTICNSCNVKANTNRDWHKGWYQAVLTRRYNYKY